MKNITDKFQFSIQNGLSNHNINVAIAHGNIDVEGFATTAETVSGSLVYSTVKHHHDVSGLVKEGFGVDTVLDDAVAAVTVSGETANVTMQAADSTKSIRHALEYLKTNPRDVKQISIVVGVTGLADKSAAFKTMSLANMNPFHREAARDIDLQQFFSENQFQSGKITMSYAKGDFCWGDDLFWSIVVVKGTSLDITVEFYNED